MLVTPVTGKNLQSGKYDASTYLFQSPCSSQYLHYPLHWIRISSLNQPSPMTFLLHPTRRFRHEQWLLNRQFLSTYEGSTQSKEGCHLRKHDSLGIVISYERMLMTCWRLPAVPPQGKVVFKEEWLYPSHITKNVMVMETICFPCYRCSH